MKYDNRGPGRIRELMTVCVVFRGAWIVVVFCIMISCGCAKKKALSDELIVVVADTSAVELFCTCSPDVSKHYEALRKSMERALGKSVRFEYMTDFLFDALPVKEAQRLRKAHLIIGKCTAVEHVSMVLNIRAECVGVLTRTNGSPDFAGIWIAREKDGVHNLAGLAGKRISIGRSWHAEKHGDALLQLSADNIVPATVTEQLLCKETITDVVFNTSDAAVISDYAVALLADTNVTHGVDMTVIGRTSPRPYIGAFATGRLAKEAALLRPQYYGSLAMASPV